MASSRTVKRDNDDHNDESRQMIRDALYSTTFWKLSRRNFGNIHTFTYVFFHRNLLAISFQNLFISSSLWHYLLFDPSE